MLFRYSAGTGWVSIYLLSFPQSPCLVSGRHPPCGPDALLEARVLMLETPAPTSPITGHLPSKLQFSGVAALVLVAVMETHVPTAPNLRFCPRSLLRFALLRYLMSLLRVP